jgi:hypothetical protein
MGCSQALRFAAVMFAGCGEVAAMKADAASTC